MRQSSLFYTGHADGGSRGNTSNKNRQQLYMHSVLYACERWAAFCIQTCTLWNR